MAKGSYYRASERTGGFSNALKPLTDYLGEIRAEREKEENLNNLISAYKEARDRQEQPVNNLAPEPGSFAIFPEGFNPIKNTPAPVKNPLADTQYDPRLQGISRYNRAQDEAEGFLTSQLGKPKVDLQTLQLLSNVLSGNAERMKPKKPITENVPYGGMNITRDPDTGEVIDTIINEREAKTPVTRLLGEGEYGGKQGIKYGYMDESGNEVVTKFDEFKKESGGDSAAWANLDYRIRKDEEAKKEKETKTQSQYDAIIKSPWMSFKELEQQGIDVSSIDDDKYGGAYFVRDDKAKDGYRLITTNKQLESFAESKVPDAPRKAKLKRFIEKIEEIPEAAKKYLKENPDLKDQFDEKYGRGASKYILEE
jgi:hypothetical protein